VKSDLERLLREALRSLVPHVLSDAVDPAQVVVERARDTQHGDFQSNIAMRIAKAARKNPRELAQALVAALPKSALVAAPRWPVPVHQFPAGEGCVVHAAQERGGTRARTTAAATWARAAR
jgi:hypothetical protein